MAALPARQRLVAERHRRAGRRPPRPAPRPAIRAPRGGRPHRRRGAGRASRPAAICSVGERLTRPPSSCSDRPSARASPASPDFSRAGPPWTTRAAAITPLQAAIRGRPGQRLVGAALEMAGAAGERVEQARAVDRVGAGEDVGRIGGPEQDAPAPQIGAPGRLADLLGDGGEPFAGDPFGELGAALARRRGGKVAQPGEALQIVGEILGQADRREIEAGDLRPRCRCGGSGRASSASPAALSPAIGSLGTAISFSGTRPRSRSAWSGVRQAKRWSR